MKKKIISAVIISITCFLNFPSNGVGQVVRTDNLIILDSLHVNLNEVIIQGRKQKRKKHYRATKEYWRTVRNIRIVYPYAEMANKTITDLNKELEFIVSKKERRKLIQREYKGLMKEYKAPLMKLKISQGKLLMTLIDKETGDSSYKHIKELKGSTTAIFWQTIASMFGTSLKSKYEPEGKDWMVEEILERMKKGELPPPLKIEFKTDNSKN